MVGPVARHPWVLPVDVLVRGMTDTPASLAARLPEGGFSGDDDALDAFLAWVADAGIEPYPAQEDAALELYAGHHVLLKTPTGSGKSLVALALHFRALAAGKRSVYTAPIKALVTEKFLALCQAFGAENVGLMTGDGAVHADAPIVCCTAEVLSQMALRQAEETPFHAVIMDEFHYYGDRDRGMAWQVPLLTMPHAQFLLMSATLGDTTAIERDLAERTGVDVVAVVGADRPVPLDFSYAEEMLDVVLGDLIGRDRAPVYVVHFSQRAAMEHAQALLSTDFCSKEEKEALKVAVKGMRFDSPFGPTLRRMVLHGVGLHHAGLLPKYRLLVEQVAQKGLFKVICGTDTLGVGINVPIRSVLFSQLCKFDGQDVNILSVRHFQQIAGRAGRKGFDDQGYVVAKAPDWIVENARLQRAIDAGTKSKKKARKSQPPTKGYKHWDAETFDKLVSSPPEPLESRFVVDHAFVLSLLQRAEQTLGDATGEMHALIDRSHESERSKAKLHEQVEERLAQLVAAGVAVDHGEDGVPRYTVHTDMQDDFSIHHALSLFLLFALEKLDKTSPEYAGDVIGLVEAILEHPRPVLQALVQRAKGDLIGALKADGVPYEERMEALEEVTWPKPKAEWIYAVFEEYRATHPWLEGEPVRVKAVVRELVDTQAVFSTWVKSLRIERMEGVALRYITQVYRTLLRNVPEAYVTDDLTEALAFLRAMLARVDDSLVQTWSSLLAGEDDDLPVVDAPIDVSADMKAFRARIRAELYAIVHALAAQDYEEAAACVRDTDEAWTAEDFRKAAEAYEEAQGPVRFDARLKQGWTTQVEPDGPHRWKVRQILVDDGVSDDEYDQEGDAWAIEGIVDLTDDTNPPGVLVQVVAFEA